MRECRTKKDAIEELRAGRGCVYADQVVPEPSGPLSVRAARAWIEEHVDGPGRGRPVTVDAPEGVYVRLATGTLEALQAEIEARDDDSTVAGLVREAVEERYGR